MVNISENYILSYLKERCQEDWLIGYDSDQFYALTESYYQQFKTDKPDNIFLLYDAPFDFLAAFFGSIVANIPAFLASYHWKAQEWQQVLELVEPDLIIGGSQPITPLLQGKNIRERQVENTRHLIMIPTGGTSGKIRFVVHNWQTLTASVKGFYPYFNVKNINSFCILPLNHVSGLMQFLRSFLTGGKFFHVAYPSLKDEINKGGFKDDNFSDYFISLVPTQLQFLLDANPSWLSQFHTVLLGGAPAWPSLLEQAREYKINLAPTYGMTETASQVVTLKPSDFLKGNNSTGQVLPHAKITLSSPENGVIMIESESLFLGYYGQEIMQNQIFYTDDIGKFDDHQYLYILGRNSQKIISGGENIYPAEIEAVILGTKLVKDVAVVGFPDAYWGEIVIAIYVLNDPGISTAMLIESCRSQLSKYKCPKYWIAVENLPRNSQGKLNHQQLRDIIMSQIK